MTKWKTVTVTPETTLAEAISKVDASGLQIAIVLDADGRLAGVVTDGDIRRAFLRGISVNIPVTEVMNRNPLSVRSAASEHQMLATMRRATVHHLPVLDERRRVVGLVTLDELTHLLPRPNWVVIMAGGLGSRLQPLTNDLPKSLLPVAGKPILETILEGFAEQGFTKVFLAVNYKAEMIRAHFESGERWGIDIQYLHEEKRLGTAGALSLLPMSPVDPVIVMNSDLLTRADFGSMLQFHERQGVVGTMVVREHEQQVPYGVVRLNGASIQSIEEKPTHRFFVNAGIYVLSPKAIEHIRNRPPLESALDMPTFFDDLKSAGMPTAGYTLREFWLDIGRLEELERAQHEWVRAIE